MGGSASAGDIISNLVYDHSPIPCKVIKGGSLPRFVGENSLVVVSSLSGNTEETLSMAKEALKRHAEVICISSGGKLKELADRNASEHVTIPNLGLSRASLPYLIMPCLSLVDNFMDIKLDFKTMEKELKAMRNKVIVTVVDERNLAKQISGFLRGGLAFCFASPALIAAGTRFKDSLNENAKVHCLEESILEASHNEIVPFSFEAELSGKVLLLSWARDSTLVRNRFKRVCSFFQRIRQPYMQIISNEKDDLSALICSIYLLDFSSIYIAKSRGIDPCITPAIDIIKGTK